jgi:hypothetical protein
MTQNSKIHQVSASHIMWPWLTCLISKNAVNHESSYSCFHNYAESQKVELQFGNVRQGPRKAMRESNTVAYQTWFWTHYTMSTMTPKPENATFKTVLLINLILYNPVKPSTKEKKSEEKVNKLIRDCWSQDLAPCSSWIWGTSWLDRGWRGWSIQVTSRLLYDVTRRSKKMLLLSLDWYYDKLRQ